MMPRPRLSDEDQAEIKRLHGLGCTMLEISKTVRRDRSTIRRVLGTGSPRESRASAPKLRRRAGAAVVHPVASGGAWADGWTIAPISPERLRAGR